jgi:hypothetical protein
MTAFRRRVCGLGDAVPQAPWDLARGGRRQGGIKSGTWKEPARDMGNGNWLEEAGGSR